MFSDVFKNKTVLITGHTGFKGSWLTLWLHNLGAKVIGYSLEPPSVPNFFEACNLKSRMTHIHGDVRDLQHLIEIFDIHQPEFVLHLAAQPLVRLSYADPLTTYETNIMGTVNLLEAVRQTKSVKVVVNITSDKCYENNEWAWAYRENDPMGGHDPYSSSKGCAELVTSTYLRSFFNPEHYDKKHHVGLASVRAGNVIGGGDWGNGRLLPDCVRSLSNKEEIIIRYPKAIRPWQHVLEPLSGYLHLASKLRSEGPKYSGAWNFGPMDAEVWTVEEVTREVCKLWGDGKYAIDNQTQLHEANWLKLDCSKARIELGWKPIYPIKLALEKTVSWYKEFYSNVTGDALRSYTLNQIEEYAASSDLQLC